MKLSIITPYYKTLEYTKKLAKALEPQLTKDVEWIIVDDGCNEKELNELKAKVIHLDLPSGNASKPRNIGLDNAKGEYISFIDSDDLVSGDYVEKILEKTKEEWDYCYISWNWVNGNIIIDDIPPSWNTCVWNCVYKKELIGKTRFDINKNIAEDEEFNKKVRNGIKANIKEVLYYYNWQREDSLTTRYSQGKIKKEVIKCGLLVYQKFISKIGGIETFIYEFLKAFHKEYDITFVYKEADENQLRRYREFVRCIKFKNQQFECDKYLCASNQDNIADNVVSHSGEYYDMIHADLTAMDWTYRSHPKTTKHIAVSNIAKESIEKQDDKPCIVIYNLLEMVKPKTPIRIMSAQRVSVEKGENEMKRFARRLNERQIPFIWINFTDNKIGEEDGILYKKCVLNIQDYFNAFDFFASFSKTESYGYSLVQSMSYGLPIIVRDIPVLKELGFKDGEHGYKVDYDLSNIDEVIDKMLEKVPVCEYKKLDDKKEWIKLLGKLNKYNDYEKLRNTRYIVEALPIYEMRNMTDSQLGRVPTTGERWEVSQERLETLLGDNSLGVPVVKMVKEVV